MDEQQRQIWIPYLIVALVFICGCCVIATAVAMPLTYNLFRYFQIG